MGKSQERCPRSHHCFNGLSARTGSDTLPPLLPPPAPVFYLTTGPDSTDPQRMSSKGGDKLAKRSRQTWRRWRARDAPAPGAGSSTLSPRSRRPRPGRRPLRAPGQRGTRTGAADGTPGRCPPGRCSAVPAAASDGQREAAERRRRSPSSGAHRAARAAREVRAAVTAAGRRADPRGRAAGTAAARTLAAAGRRTRRGPGRLLPAPRSAAPPPGAVAPSAGHGAAVRTPAAPSPRVLVGAPRHRGPRANPRLQGKQGVRQEAGATGQGAAHSGICCYPLGKEEGASSN